MSKKTKEENVAEIWAEIAEMTTMMKDANGKGERGIPAPETGVAIPKQENLGSSSDMWSSLEAELNNLLETANGGSLVYDPDDQTGVADVEAVTMVKPEPLEQKPTVILPQTSSVSTMNGISVSDAAGNNLTASNAGVSYIPAIKNECGDITIKTEPMPQAFVKLEVGVISEIDGTNYMLVDDFPSLIKQEIDIKPECLPQFETSSSVGTLPVPQEAPVFEDIKPSVEKLKKVLGDVYLEKKKEAESIQASKGTGELARRTPGEAKLKQKKVAENAQSTNAADNLDKPTSCALDGDAKLNERKEADGTQSEKGTDELEDRHTKDVTSQENELNEESDCEVSDRKSKKNSKNSHSAVAKGAMVSRGKSDSVKANRTEDKDLGNEKSRAEQGRGRGAKVSGDTGDSEEATRTVDKDLGKERNGDKQGQERSSRKKCVSDAKNFEGDEERLKHDKAADKPRFLSDKAADKPRFLVDREEGGFSDMSDDNDADVRMSDLTPPESDSEIEEIEDNTQRDLKVEDYFQDSDFSSDDSDLGCPDMITIDDSVPTPKPVRVPVPVRVPKPGPVPVPASAPVAVTKPVNKERLVKRERPPSSEDDSSEDDSDEDPWWGNELSSTKRSRIMRVNRGRKHQPPTKKMRSRNDLASVEIVEEEIITVNAGGSRSYNCPFCMLNLPYRTANNFMSHIDAKHSEINTDFKEKRDKLLAILFPLNTENGRSQEPERKNIEKEEISIEALQESDFMHLNDKGEKQYTCKFCKYTVPYQNLNTLMTHLHKVHKELTANLKRQISDMLFDAPQVQATPKQDEAVSTSSALKSGSTTAKCKSKQKKAKKGEASESVNLLPGAKRETLVRNGDGVYEFQCQFCPIPIKYKSANVLMSHIQAKHKNIVQNKATMALMKKDMYDNPNLEMELSCGNMNVQRVAKKPLVPPPAPVKKPIQEKPVIEVGKDGKKMYRCKYCVISLVYHSPNVLMTHLGKKHQDIRDTPEHVHLLKYIYNGEFHDDDFETFCEKEDRKAGKGTSKDGKAKSKEEKKKRRVDSDDESDDDDRRKVEERRKDKKEMRKKETGEGPLNRDREQDSDQGTTKKGKATKNGKHFVKKSSSEKDARKENGSGGKDGGRDSNSGGKDGRSGRSSGSKDRQRDSIHLGKEGQRHSSSGGKDGRKDSSSRGKDSTRDSGDLRQQKDKMTVNRHLKTKGIEAKCRECGKVFMDGKLYRAHILTHF